MGAHAKEESSSVQTAKDETAAVTHTATDAAQEVGHAAKNEADAVVDESTDQVRELYQQTRSELAEKAAKQQDRVATGLQTVGDDLSSMARNSEDSGLAREFVNEASQRVSRVATWLSNREPGEVLEEVKTFARRQPGVFIGAVTLAGAVTGRLTRALASNSHEDQEVSPSLSPTPRHDTRVNSTATVSPQSGAGAHSNHTSTGLPKDGASSLPGTAKNPVDTAPPETHTDLRGRVDTDDRPDTI